jgi:hypothetical protein
MRNRRCAARPPAPARSRAQPSSRRAHRSCAAVGYEEGAPAPTRTPYQGMSNPFGVLILHNLEIILLEFGWFLSL